MYSVGYFNNYRGSEISMQVIDSDVIDLKPFGYLIGDLLCTHVNMCGCVSLPRAYIC